uniref:Uncharacterized protein n=1 Tax=Monopterus albus TaxID=43700 RepID=A0A3Q3K4W6_MONAL
YCYVPFAPVSERTRKRRTQLDAARSKTRINIGVAFEQWQQLREQRGLKSDDMVAMFLLDNAFGRPILV